MKTEICSTSPSLKTSNPRSPKVINPPPDVTWLTVAELCARWNISVMTIWRLRRKGVLVPMKLGNSVRFRLGDVERIEREAMA